MTPKKTKPNQPCHCGSGKKYKKCCKVKDDISSSLDAEESPAAQDDTNAMNNYEGPPLRFKIGDKILANVNYKWLPGKVFDTYYHESSWPNGKVSPYQILLDAVDDESERLIHAPLDGDTCIQQYDESKDESRMKRKKKKKRDGKQQLRSEAKWAERELEERMKSKKDTYIPECGDEETNQKEFSRSGMLEANFVCTNDFGYLSLMLERAGWCNLRMPTGVDRDSILEFLESLFLCLPRLRGKGLMLEDEDIELFMEQDALQLLPSLLHMCLAPEQFTSSDDEMLGPSEFIWDCVSLLESLQSQGGLRLNGHLVKELCAILRVCTSKVVGDTDNAIFLAYETIDPLFENADESAFLTLLDELQSPFPCRGHSSSLAYRAMSGEPWVDSHHVGIFCSTISALLVDPSTSEETNAELFGVVLSMLENPDLVERVLSMTLDSLRNCQIHMKLDTSIHGGLDTLIKTASQTIAAANGNDDELFLLKEIFSTDSRGIVTCYCQRHSTAIPILVCNAELEKETKEVVICMINDTVDCLELQQYDKALEMTTKAIKAIETEIQTGGLLLFDLTLKRKVHALRGRAQLRLGGYEDALYCLSVAIGGDPSDKGSLVYGNKSSKLRCDACLDGIHALACLGHIDRANEWYSYLMGMNTAQSEGDFTAQYLAKAQAKAAALVSNVPTVSAVPATLIDSKPAREGISCSVRQCTWRSVGKVAEEDGTFYTATHAAPRLHIALLWVRGQLLIWNYKSCSVVQWVHKPGHEHCPQELIHTADSSLFVLYASDGLPYIILLDQVHKMKQGGTCSAENAMLVTLGMNYTENNITRTPSILGDQTYDDWGSLIFAVRFMYGSFSNFASAQNMDTKGWSLAMVKDSAKAEIFVFTGDETIAPGLALGPFALLKCEASFVFRGGGNAHLKRIYELIFVENGKANKLISSSGDKSIKVWDLASRSCQHTIRGFSNLVRTIASTSSLIFGVADRNHGRHGTNSDEREQQENSTFGSHCINVWDIESGQHLATLRSKSGRSIESLITIPQCGILLSGHVTGEVHVWRYDKFEHIHGIKALPGSSTYGLSFHLHNSYVVIMSMKQLVMLKDPTQIEGNDKGASLPLVGHSLNCGNCGIWKIDSSSSCSRCQEVRFCDEVCMKEAWPKHRKSCRKRK